MEFDIILRHWGGQFMPIVKNGQGKEVYRGDYRDTATEALERAEGMIPVLKRQGDLPE